MIDAYSKFHFLIVDDFPQFRQAMKLMVESFGARNIELAANGEQAIKALRGKHFDVVLCDYNLGMKKNGQQVLEEARHLKIIRNSAVFCMVTAETTSDMVLGALEYQPDDYLTKPFNKTMLKSRLDKIIARKFELSKVTKAWDSDQLAVAVQQCDVLLDKKSRYALMVKKIKGELLLDLKKYKQAAETYDEVLRSRRMPWAILGRAKAYFFLKEYEQAKQLFNEILNINKSFVSAFDWLAMIDEAQGDLIEAQQKLQEAVKLSPRHIVRQLKLGELSMENQDYEQAEHAFRQTVNIGQHSILNKPSNYLKLSESLVKQVDEASVSERERLSKDVLNVMIEAREIFSNDKELQVHSRLYDAEAYRQLGRKQEAISSLNIAADMFQTVPELLKDDAVLKLAEMYQQLGEVDKANSIEDIAQEHGILAEVQLEMNNKGVSYYQQGLVEEALEAFDEAIVEQPEHISANLNGLQACLKLVELKGHSRELIQKTEQYIERIANMKLLGRRQQRFEKLQQIFEKIRS